MSQTEKSPSPSRTYVLATETDGFTHFSFKKFHLPEEFKNTCENATWYFYNRLDFYSCGASAFSFEDYSDIREIGQK